MRRGKYVSGENTQGEKYAIRENMRGRENIVVGNIGRRRLKGKIEWGQGLIPAPTNPNSTGD